MRIANEARTAIRQAIRSHADWTSTAQDLRTRGLIRPDVAKINDLDKSEMLSLAASLGLDVAGIVASVSMASHAAVAAVPQVAPVAAPQDDTPEAPEAEGDAPDVSGEVDNVLAPLAPFLPLVSQDIRDALRDNVADLATRAATPRIVHVSVPAPAAPQGGNVVQLPAAPRPVAPSLPVARVKSQETVSSRFGIRDAWATKMTMDVWDAVDAPRPDRGFVFDREVLRDVLACMRDGSAVWLAGPAGTGKTSLAQEVAARLGRPFVRVPFDTFTEPLELFGSTGLENGTSVYRPGVLLEAIQRPGTVILLDEPTAATKCHFALQTLLDMRFVTVKEDGGRVVRVAPGVSFIAADNTAGTGDSTGHYTGTGTANLAFRDRFAAVVPVGYLDQAQEVQALVDRTGTRHDVAHALVTFANVTRTAASVGKLSVGLGLRRLIAFAQGLDAGIPAARCYAARLRSQAVADDQTALDELAKAHLNLAELDRLASGAPAAPPASQATVLDPAAQERARARFDNV